MAGLFVYARSQTFIQTNIQSQILECKEGCGERSITMLKKENGIFITAENHHVSGFS